MGVVSRRYEYHYVSESSFVPAVARHFFKLRAVPCDNSCQRVESSRFSLQPSGCLLNESNDSQGNKIQLGSYDLLHSFFRMESEGVVCCSPYHVVDEYPNDCYLYPSALTQCDSSLRSWTLSVVLGESEPLAKAKKLMHAVNEYLSYQKGVTSNKTTALDAFALRSGVCQDFSHLMVALCRCVGLYARYVNGLVLGQGETHAWVEVYDGRQWMGFDPTFDKLIDWGYVKIAHGRDVYDCPSNRGQFISYSGINELLTVKCEVKEI